jgi:tetratricopeptide (TPR) repeat protein
MLLLAVALCAAALPARAAAQANPNALALRLDEANDALRDGSYPLAYDVFSEVLQRLPPHERGLRASALFGRAFATRQMVAPDTGPRGTASVDALVAEYLEARRLDSLRLYGVASNNAALLLYEAGRYREALALFLAAAAVNQTGTPYFLFNAGRAYEALRLPDSAALAYRRSLRSDSTYVEACAALLRLALVQGQGDAAVAVAERWGAAPQMRAVVNDALLDLVSPVSREWAQRFGLRARERALVLLARNHAASSTAPGALDPRYRDRLRVAAKNEPSELRTGIGELLGAYRPREPGEPVPEPRTADRRWSTPRAAEWWSQGDDRLAAWSATLRSVGDAYLRSGDEPAALAYYEAALGAPERPLEPWVDLGAMLPLARIYLRQPDGEARLERYERRLFEAKQLAYQKDDIRQIRHYHMTLGALFAEQGRWGSPGNPTGAIFQLERMREFTQRLRSLSQPVTDPPELNERLATAYAATGDTSRAVTVAREASSAYVRLGRAEDAQRVDAWILRPERQLRPPKPPAGLRPRAPDGEALAPSGALRGALADSAAAGQAGAAVANPRAQIAQPGGVPSRGMTGATLELRAVRARRSPKGLVVEVQLLRPLAPPDSAAGPTIYVNGNALATRVIGPDLLAGQLPRGVPVGESNQVTVALRSAPDATRTRRPLTFTPQEIR